MLTLRFKFRQKALPGAFNPNACSFSGAHSAPSDPPDLKLDFMCVGEFIIYRSTSYTYQSRSKRSQSVDYCGDG